MNNNILTDPASGGILASIIGLATLTGIIAFDSCKTEHFGNDEEHYNMQKQQLQAMTERQFYQEQQPRHVHSNNVYRGPDINVPEKNLDVNLNTSGDQMLSYQLYQQAVNAATPTQQQLDSISGQSQEQTGPRSQQLGGGLSEDTAPYNILGQAQNNLYSAEFQAVNMGNNPRAESISACAQNAPTFVATSLLPKPEIPGEKSWDVNAPNNILANQNFLSATQQVGVDTVLGSLRNPSYDIRNDIPNPINVVSPWNQTTILPQLEKRPLDCFLPDQGIYGCASSGGANTNGTYVGE